MEIDLTTKEFRRLLDMVYIGNWVLNSMRTNDRFEDYDHVESKIFSYCAKTGMPRLYSNVLGVTIPSDAFAAGGIHDAIANYEDSVFFEMLAEELAVRDMNYEAIGPENFDELGRRIDEYVKEFDENGVDNISVDK